MVTGGVSQELFKFCGGNKSLAAELMIGLDADGSGEAIGDATRRLQ